MSGRVPSQRYEPDPDAIRIGVGISSGQHWLPMGFLANWLNGSGAMLVPGAVIDKTVTSGTTAVLHFNVAVRAQAIERQWTLMLRSTSSACVATIKAPTSTGTAVAVPVSAGRDVRLPIIYREILSAQTPGVTDITIEIAAAGGDIEIDSLTCCELARPLLQETTNNEGVNTETLRPRERIFEGTGYTSATGIFAASTADIRRVGMYHWAVPVGQPITTTGAYTDVVSLAMPILAPLLTSGQTTGQVYWSAYAKVSSGSGDVRITYQGGTDSVTVTGTSFAWTTPKAISVDCEDMTTADGRRAGAWVTILPSFRANGGVTMSLAGVSVWNEAF
jgi:hypothetical protein